MIGIRASIVSICAFLLAAGLEALPIEVAFRSAQPAAPVAAQLRLVRSVFVDQKLVETTTHLDVTVPGSKTLSLEPGTWRLELTAPTLFAPPALVQVGGAASLRALDFVFWPTVELVGSL